MTNTHTPGPHKVKVTPNDLDFEAVILDAQEKEIACVYIATDARLYAASPDMYDKLNHIYTRLTVGAQKYDASAEEIEELRQLLLKATGKPKSRICHDKRPESGPGSSELGI